MKDEKEQPGNGNSPTDRKIEIGLRIDNTPFIEYDNALSPIETLGLIKWAYTVIETDLKELYNYGSGKHTRMLKSIGDEVRNLTAILRTGQIKMFQMMERNAKSLQDILVAAFGIINPKEKSNTLIGLEEETKPKAYEDKEEEQP